MLHAVFVVVIVCSRSKLNFLDRDRHLFLLRFVCLLLRFVLIFSEIDDATNRRIGVGRNLDEVQSFLTGGAHCVAHIMTPICSPSSPITRTSGTRILSLIRTGG